MATISAPGRRFGSNAGGAAVAAGPRRCNRLSRRIEADKRSPRAIKSGRAEEDRGCLQTLDVLRVIYASALAGNAAKMNSTQLVARMRTPLAVDEGGRCPDLSLSSSEAAILLRFFSHLVIQ